MLSPSIEMGRGGRGDLSDPEEFEEELVEKLLAVRGAGKEREWFVKPAPAPSETRVQVKVGEKCAR